MRIYGNMLQVYTSAIYINRANDMWNRMKELSREIGVELLRDDYFAMIQMYCRSKRMERAFDFYDLYRVKGYKPTLKLYRQLIFGCNAFGMVQSGMRLLREMREREDIYFDGKMDFVIKFRSGLSHVPHLMKEIDKLSGEAYIYTPPWKRHPSGRRITGKLRSPSKEEWEVVNREIEHIPVSHKGVRTDAVY